MVPEETQWIGIGNRGMRFQLSTLLLAVLFPVSACAQDVESSLKKDRPETQTKEPAPRLPADRTKFAVVISGLGGEEAYTQQFTKWATTLHALLIERLGFSDKQTFLLVERPGEGQARSTADELRKVFLSLREAANAESTVFVFMLGHGSSDGKQSKFNLIGPDLVANDYATLVKSLPTRRVNLINMTSASGDFIKPLSAEGSVTVTATRSGQEQNATKFPEFFIAALGQSEADLDKNGRVSVLEAFDFAVKSTASFYEKQGRLATEHALLDDNGDGVGHSKAEAGDGGLARITYFDSIPQQQAGGDAELAKLFAERMRLEGAIEQLKSRKEKMKIEEYEAELERVLIELATLNQKLRARQK